MAVKTERESGVPVAVTEYRPGNVHLTTRPHRSVVCIYRMFYHSAAATTDNTHTHMIKSSINTIISHSFPAPPRSAFFY